MTNYTEIRINHKTKEEKKDWENKVEKNVKDNGFNSRAEFVKVICLNAKINIKGEKKND